MDNISLDPDAVKYKIVVFSDSHHSTIKLEKLLPIINSADYMVFCGDGANDIMRVHGRIAVPAVCVKGNNDFASNFTELAFTQFGETKALVTHGHKYDVRRSLDMLCGMADMHDCRLVFFGHTHTYCDRIDRGIHLINPGALCNGSYAIVEGDGVNFVSKQCFI